MTESELSLDEARAKLKAHFPGEDSAKPEGWEALWQGSWLVSESLGLSYSFQPCCGAFKPCP